jgi:hypothetical protein
MKTNTSSEQPLTHKQLMSTITFFAAAWAFGKDPINFMLWAGGTAVVVVVVSVLVAVLVTTGKAIWAKIAPARPLAGDMSGLGKTPVRHRLPTANDRQAVNTAALDWAARWDRSERAARGG